MSETLEGSHTLDGTVALVTGASSGIGEAAAASLARRGASIAVVARRTERLEKLAGEIRDAGGTALTITADVTDQEEAKRAVAQTVDELGRLDTVINNAGVMLLGPIVDAPTEEWDRMVDLNVKGLLYVAHAALPHLLKAAEDSPRQVADLVNISSVAGRVARNGSGVYNATKHAVGAFSESLRQEVTGRHVRVSLVEPGAVATELASHNREEILPSLRERFGSMERLEAEDIAEVIEFIVTRSRRVAVNEVLVRPTEQEG
jgi:NADP-dependent 3-hydroxy acid dehydrogenase YdfG